MLEDQNKKGKLKKLVATWKAFSGRFLLLYLFACLVSCEQRKELVDKPLYEGPISSLDSINTILSDSGKFVMKLQAPTQSNFDGGDIEWSEGVFVEYFDAAGERITTKFKANYVYYTNEDQLYRATGNVVVKNYETGDELTTEELFWDEKNEEYYTEKYVTINSDDEVHTGEGLKANKDFSEYEILNPNGTFTLEDDPNNQAPRDVPLSSSYPMDTTSNNTRKLMIEK